MIITPKVWGTVGAAVFTVAIAMSARAQTVNVLDFFENTTPACPNAAPSPCSGGATNVGGTNILGYAGVCPTVRLYYLRKGAGQFPWGSETYWVRGDYLVGAQEQSYNETNGHVLDDPNVPNRVFRELSNHYKGVPYMPLTVGPAPAVINVPFSQEVWVDAAGHRSCNGDHTIDYSESYNQWSETYYDPNTMEAIYDCRGPQGCGTTPGWASVVVRRDHWGSGNVETYTFGRWNDPRTGVTEGLGLIGWDAEGPDWNPPRHEHPAELWNSSYTWVPCGTCPDY